MNARKIHQQLHKGIVKEDKSGCGEVEMECNKCMASTAHICARASLGGSAIIAKSRPGET
jgi:hypothetical protein